MSWGFSLPVVLAGLAVASAISGNSSAADYVGDHEQTRITMKPESPAVTETSKYIDIIFAKEPESRFFVHGTDRFIAVAQPGKRTVAPSFDQVKHLTFVEADRRLVVEWKISDGGMEKATFDGMDRVTWEQLKQFVATQVGSGLEMRE